MGSLRAGAALVCAALISLRPVPSEAAPASTVLVAFDERVGARPAAAVLERVGAGPVTWLPHGAVIRTSRPGAVMASLRKDPDVAAVAADGPVRVETSPSDPRFHEQWNLEQPSDADIDARKGWARLFGVGPGGRTRFPRRAAGPAVGLIDTGIDLDHADLQGAVTLCGRASNGTVVRGGCGDDEGHGTAVAGIQAARTNNGRGMASVGPGLRLGVCKALDASGNGTWSDVLACAAWLAEFDIPVISMSFSGQYNPVAEAVFDTVWDGGRGPLLVAAAGNGGLHVTTYPAGFASVVSVGATNQWDGVWGFSNRNPDVELAAPGRDILSTRRGGGYAVRSGTSMAVPHVAGIAGLVTAVRPAWDGGDLRAALVASAEDLGPVGRDQHFGWGRVNLARAAKAAVP